MERLDNNPARNNAPPPADQGDFTDRFKSAVAKEGSGADDFSHGRFSQLSVMPPPPPPPPPKRLPPGSPVNPGGPRPLPPKNEMTDVDVENYLKSLGDAVSPAQKEQLEQIGNDLTTLLDFFNAYPNGAPQLNHNIPPVVAAAEKRLLAVTAIRKQLVTQSGPDKGLVTRYTVSNFLDSLNNAATSAQSSWQSFKSADPDASAPTQQMAVDASLVQAYLPVMDDASTYSKVDGLINTNNLLTVADSAGDASLPTALKNAAALFAKTGVFSNIDTAGANPATATPDGLADDSNLAYFVSNVVPKLGANGIVQMLTAAAYQNMTKGVPTANLGANVFKNPQDYSGAQKAAVLQKLLALKAQIQAGYKQGYWDPTTGDPFDNTLAQAGISPQEPAVMAQLNGRIAQLQSDPTVVKFLSNGLGKSLQSIVGADPGMHKALEQYFRNDVASGTNLKDAVNSQGVFAGTQAFLQNANALALALGSGGKPVQIDFSLIAERSGLQGEIEHAYQSQILNANELKKAIANGTHLTTAINQFTGDASALGMLLPSKYVAAHAGELEKNYANALNDSLSSIGTKGDLEQVYGNANGTLDTAKLKAIIQATEKQDPKDFENAQGQPLSADKLVAEFKYCYDQIRQGAKFNDALYKTQVNAWKAGGKVGPEPTKPSGPLAESYSQGTLHAVSALLNTAVLITKGAEGTAGSATGDVSVAANAAQVVGGLMEAGAKNLKANNPYAGDKAKAFEAQLKTLESAGKVVGGVGSAATGALSIFAGVEALSAGEKPAGGVDIGTGILNVLSGGLSIAEGGANLGASAGLWSSAAGEETAALIGAVAAPVGIVTAAVTAFADLGLSIYEAVEEQESINSWTGDIVSGLSQWGITGGGPSKNPGVAPPNSYPP